MAETFDDLFKAELTFELYSRQVEQIAAGCRQSGTDLAGAVQQARRKLASAAAAQEKATEKTELQKAAANAKLLLRGSARRGSKSRPVPTSSGSSRRSSSP